ncbi:unnamed protein product [Boreogadus saida]
MSQIPGTEGVLSQADPPSSDSASQPQAYKPPLPEAPPVMDEVSPSSTSSFEMLDMDAPPPPYRPVTPHWFYCGRADDGSSWLPFSREDSGKLEQAHADVGTRAERVVAVEGERYDVRVGERRRHAVYWEQAPSEVRRCTWFYKGDKDLRFFPYGEDMAARLEWSTQTTRLGGTTPRLQTRNPAKRPLKSGPKKDRAGSRTSGGRPGVHPPPLHPPGLVPDACPEGFAPPGSERPAQRSKPPPTSADTQPQLHPPAVLPPGMEGALSCECDCRREPYERPDGTCLHRDSFSLQGALRRLSAAAPSVCRCAVCLPLRRLSAAAPSVCRCSVCLPLRRLSAAAPSVCRCAVCLPLRRLSAAAA